MVIVWGGGEALKQHWGARACSSALAAQYATDLAEQLVQAVLPPPNPCCCWSDGHHVLVLRKQQQQQPVTDCQPDQCRMLDFQRVVCVSEIHMQAQETQTAGMQSVDRAILRVCL